MNTSHRPRLSIDISEEQQQRLLSMNLPWGWQRALFSKIIDNIIEIHDKYGSNAIACIVAGQVKPAEVMGTIGEAESLGEKLKEDSNES